MGLRYCGIGQFFMRDFGNFNFKLRYCGVLRICGMRYFWRFGQRYLIKKKLFYTVSDPLTGVRDSCHSQAIRKSMHSKLSSYHNGNGNAFIWRIFYVDIFKCTLQQFVGDFPRLLYGAVHNLFNVTSSIHRYPQNRMSDARPQQRELHALLFTFSVWIL